MDELHNLFFYANVCHVCKAFSKELPLKRCGSCQIISYCGKEHQKQHWPQHKYLCKILSDLRQETGSSLFPKPQDSSNKSWPQVKTNLMLIVALKSSRRLELYEEQMFKFPRACVVCHESESKTLQDCQNCPGASFCPLHKSDSVHEKQCASLKLCFDLDVTATLFERQVPRHVVPFHTDRAYLPSTIRDFIDLYVNENKTLPMSFDCRIAYTSEYLTRPLTLLYAIQRLDYSPGINMTIHVIGANVIELDGLEVWEILLHWLPALTVLRIILIGPELTRSTLIPNVCDCCAVEDMRVHVDVCNMLYQDYVNSHGFENPDFIIGYNVGLHECEDFSSENDTWSPCVRSLGTQNCPVILTSYTLEEAKKDHERICAVLGDTVALVLCEHNPFASLRPHRDFEVEDVYYQNQIITIYRELSVVTLCIV
ncbi:putative protein MSS51 homolog, mitochondrial [Cephus cinctus]|uniref:MYND-type domain-containing protein n=1 Tax=Cephus cinctus TaxID=211228 RepID=A0AAJ7CF32_CEPCN|nr:putative protein MSS51 homolog, mitochondrial [Cephus cinctus]